MAKQILSETNTTTILDLLAVEGAELAAINKKREATASKAFVTDIAAPTKEKKIGGFHWRLGTHVIAVRRFHELDDDQRMTPSIRKEANLSTVAPNRCSEARRYVETLDACKAFIEETGKKFTSLTALFAAMDKAAKAEGKIDSDESESDGENEAGDDTDINLETLVANFIVILSANGHTVEDAMAQLIGTITEQDAVAA